MAKAETKWRFDRLTPRQREVAVGAAHGSTNAEIAKKMDISIRTVEVHRFNLSVRLGTNSPAQLSRIVIEENEHIRRKYPELGLERF